MADWYFRLGSTNAAVSHYQLYNLPCPRFASTLVTAERSLEDDARDALSRGDLGLIFKVVEPMLEKHPYSIVIQNVISEASKKIIEIEVERGDIPRSARSTLDPKAQTYQDCFM
jgi:hypothetical protein